MSAELDGRAASLAHTISQLRLDGIEVYIGGYQLEVVNAYMSTGNRLVVDVEHRGAGG